MSNATTGYIRRRHPVWRWMIVFAFMTFALSVALMRVVSPLGDAVLASHGKHEQTQQTVPAVNASAQQASASTRPDHL
jgi:hypothetical protein